MQLSRKCQFKGICKHCYLGPAQDIKLNKQIIFDTFNTFNKIEGITLHGEATGDMEMLEFLAVNMLQASEIMEINGIAITTNGVEIEKLLALLSTIQNVYPHSPFLSLTGVSDTRFHRESAKKLGYDYDEIMQNVRRAINKYPVPASITREDSRGYRCSGNAERFKDIVKPDTTVDKDRLKYIVASGFHVDYDRSTDTLHVPCINIDATGAVIPSDYLSYKDVDSGNYTYFTLNGSNLQENLENSMDR